MADNFAPLALEFIKLHAPGPTDIICFNDEADFNREVYDFLATRYPNVELTAKTVNNLGWSITMLMYRPGR